MPQIEIMETIDPALVGRMERLPPLSLVRMHSLIGKNRRDQEEREHPRDRGLPHPRDEELLTLERKSRSSNPCWGA